MKILNAQQIKACDAFTIKSEPISSIDLMERAANACTRYLLKKFTDEHEFIIFCGKGNNGGDGLAIARHLLVRSFNVKVFVIEHSEKASDDFSANLTRLKEQKAEAVTHIENKNDLKKIKFSSAIVIDALLGSGINKSLSGILEDTVNLINEHKNFVISIDVPSGLFIDTGNKEEDVIINSGITLTFQQPKLSFLFAQNQKYVPAFEILDIGLDKNFIAQQSSPYYFVRKEDLKVLIKKRNKFSHKGNFGHALLLAGSSGKMGAAVIAAEACLRSGAGLLTVHVPKCGVQILQAAIPEAMVSADENENLITTFPKAGKHNAIGFGPGIGTEKDTAQVLKQIFNYSIPAMVLDADALNILSENKTWLSFMPEATILTPHVKEFDRLTEKHENDFDRLKTAIQFSLKHNCIVVLKGAFTQTIMPDGNVFFNSTGNAGLAKGGSGDTLTGIILGLLARGYNAPQAALIGVYVHGLAADYAIKKASVESILASDVIRKLPKAFLKLSE